MSSQETRVDRKQEIRRLLRLHLRGPEIMTTLRISRATYYRNISVIRREDRGEVERLRRDGFAHDFRLSIERLEDQVRSLMVLREKTEHDMVKVKATELIVNVEIEILNLKGYIPALMSEEVERNRAALTAKPTPLLGHRLPA